MSWIPGKITRVSFGLGGYQDSMFGLSLEFTTGGGCFVNSGVYATWDVESVPHSQHAKWTEADRAKAHDDLCRKLSKILKDAKVTCVTALVGKPVLLKFGEGENVALEGSLLGESLSDWRIFKEVL